MVDQIFSAQLGLIPHILGFLTSHIFWEYTKFLDRVSYYVYIHLMRDLYLSEIPLTKESFEKLMSKSGRTVKHYQADNNRFAYNDFIDAINKKDKNIRFCGFGAHHQNCIVKNNNKILTTSARKLLLHGMRMWPQMIDKMFWPFSMKDIAERLNSLHIYHKGRNPESIFHGVNVEDIPVKPFHTL